MQEARKAELGQTEEVSRVAVRLSQRQAVLMSPGKHGPRKEPLPPPPPPQYRVSWNTVLGQGWVSPDACWVSHKALLPGTPTPTPSVKGACWLPPGQWPQDPCGHVPSSSSCAGLSPEPSVPERGYRGCPQQGAWVSAGSPCDFSRGGAGEGKQVGVWGPRRCSALSATSGQESSLQALGAAMVPGTCPGSLQAPTCT